MGNNDQQLHAQNLQEGEISLVDILRFLKINWKTIAIFGLAGIGLSTAYLAITPKQYEAVTQIVMGQVLVAKSLGVSKDNIEEPTHLIVRMSSPTSYPQKVIAACGLQDQKNAGLMLTQLVKFTIPKKVDHIVEIKTFGRTAQAAYDCANAIFELIKTSQEDISHFNIEEARIRLADKEMRLDKEKNLATRADRLELGAGAIYLLTNAEIRFLLEEIRLLKEITSLNLVRGARLLAPIYAKDTPVSPKKHNVLGAGVLGGLLLGLSIALGRGTLNKLKSQVGRA